MTTHQCPGGCGATVQPHQLACRDDWYRLPKPLRDKINAAWRRRTTHGGREHRATVGEALAWYRANPRQAVTS